MAAVRDGGASDAARRDSLLPTSEPDDLIEAARSVVAGGCGSSDPPKDQRQGPPSTSLISGARRRSRELLEDGQISKKARQTAEEVDVLLHAAELELGWAERGSQSSVILSDPKRMSSLAMAAGGEVDLDESVCSQLGTEAAKELLRTVGTFHFDALSFTELCPKPLCALQAHLLQTSSLIADLGEGACISADSDLKAFARKLLVYMEAVDSSYLDVPYHNRSHATDVMMTLEWFLRAEFYKKLTSPLDHFMVLIAAAIHDVAHPGMNNLFFSKSMSPLALRYNDKSILENMHLAFAFDLLQRESLNCNWFHLLSKCHRPPGPDGEAKPLNLQQYVRRGLIDTVLATDMAKHPKHIAKLKDLVHEGPEQGGAVTAGATSLGIDRKLFLLGTALHAADISNSSKATPVSVRWTERVLMEFWAQGDEEKRLGLDISPMCDREVGKTSVPKGQIGFIQFVVFPYFSLISQLMPEAQEAIEQMEANKTFWQSKDAEEASLEAMFGESSPLCRPGPAEANNS